MELITLEGSWLNSKNFELMTTTVDERKVFIPNQIEPSVSAHPIDRDVPQELLFRVYVLQDDSIFPTLPLTRILYHLPPDFIRILYHLTPDLPNGSA